MLLRRPPGRPAHPATPSVAQRVSAVSSDELRENVLAFAVPRHYTAEPANNGRVGDQIEARLEAQGYRVMRQGRFGNVVALPPSPSRREHCLVGAHYDSVPGTAGADDNASGVAAALECARVLAGQNANVAFAFFNREEDGLLGSRDLAAAVFPEWSVASAHVLEMVGFCRNEPGSQRVPAGLPIRLPDRADFLGLVANGRSARELADVLERASVYVPELPVLGLEVKLGLEHLLPVLQRSDHAEFWRNGVPAVMWTDTAEFRNPHYHLASDLPETLDYDFLARVTRLLVAVACADAESAEPTTRFRPFAFAR